MLQHKSERFAKHVSEHYKFEVEGETKMLWKDVARDFKLSIEEAK